MKKRFWAAVTAVVAMLALAGPAAAQGKSEGAPNCDLGVETAFTRGQKSDQAREVVAANLIRCVLGKDGGG
jgi:hypothetical protein